MDCADTRSDPTIELCPQWALVLWGDGWEQAVSSDSLDLANRTSHVFFFFFSSSSSSFFFSSS
eukprot:5190910-Pyramimonas_sp.AAC.1